MDDGEPSTVTMEDVPETDFDEAGMYWLEGLNPGSTSIREVVPDGYMQTFPALHLQYVPLPELGPDVELPDDGFFPLPLPFPIFPYGEAHHVNVVPGSSVEGIDFGNQEIKPGSIHGTKWLDQNGNAAREDNEPGLSGVTIYVDTNYNSQLDEDEPRTVTGDDGSYSFDNVEPGFYHIREVVPEGFEQTFPLSFIEIDFQQDGILADLPFPDGQHFAFVNSGQRVDGLDFGNRKVEPQGTIQGVKWEDQNGDGVRQDNEPGLAGVTIYADLNLNGELDRGEPTATTERDNPATDSDETGQYTLMVPPGDNLVLEVVPRGYQQIHPSPFRRVRHPFNLGHSVNVPSGGELANIDFGNQRVEEELGVISGTKWVDFNANGIRDDDEPGDANVTIYIDANNNGAFDRGEPTTLTQGDNPDTRHDETGYYEFSDLVAGSYTVQQVVPFGFAPSFPNGRVRFDSHTERLSKGFASAFTLSDVSATTSADGLLNVTFDFDVTWPNGCGGFSDEETEVHFDGEMVHVFITGVEVDGFCTQAVVTGTQSVTIRDVKPGGYGVSAVFMEHLANGDHIEGFALEGKFDTSSGGSNAHQVRLGEGQHVGGLHFGSFPVPIPPLPPVEFDVNGDGEVDDADIDIVAGAMHGQDEDARGFDFTQDGTTDRGDLDHLVNDVLNTVYGDSNLDGVFDSSDLVKVFQAAEYEDGVDANSTWAEGDWDGDGDFTTSDLVFVFQKAQYSRAVSAIDAEIADRIWSTEKDKKDRRVFLA